MKIFECTKCAHPVFFENTQCTRCGSSLAFILETSSMQSFQMSNGTIELYTNKWAYKLCKNYVHNTCNWLIKSSAETKYCEACSLNRTIPDLSIPENLIKWKKLEANKQKLIYQLKQLGLPLKSKEIDPKGLCFDFLSNEDAKDDERIMTGHSDGVITIVLSEADAVHREMIKKQLSENYRTLIGHFRHEIGHYYWQELIESNPTIITKFRKVFGDERIDYAKALEIHYSKGAPNNWKGYHISSYASSHPWEDWAETWAHYLHMMDTLETAYYFGISGNPLFDKDRLMNFSITRTPYEQLNIDELIESSIAVFYMLNSVNRSMGIQDPYPFVISETVKEKLKFVHDLVRNYQ